LSDFQIQNGKGTRSLAALLGLQTQGLGPALLEDRYKGVIEMKGLLGQLEARTAVNAAMAAVGDQAILTVPSGEAWLLRTLNARMSTSGLGTMSAFVGIILPTPSGNFTVPLATSAVRTAAAAGEQSSVSTQLLDLLLFPTQQVCLQLNAAATVGTISGTVAALILPFTL